VLQAKVEGSRHESEDGNGRGWESAPTTTTITFRPSDLWALLDSNLLAASDTPSPYSEIPAGTDDSNASISLNIHVVPSLTEGRDASRRRASTSLAMSNYGEGTTNVTGNELLDFGAGGVIDPFFDDLFSQFPGGNSEIIPQ
jgi:hypothetical protein